MRAHYAISLPLMVLTLTSCAPGGASPRQPRPAGNARLIVIASEPPAQQEKTLLELIKSRLPVVVQEGRFMTEDGITSICIHARRSSGRGELSPQDSSKLPVCPPLGTYLDGVRIGDAGSHLATVRAADFECVELMSASSAMQRYGLSAAGDDVLVIWTRGRGPHAKRDPGFGGAQRE